MAMSSIDYREKIPNNVNLTEDRGLRRALERWHPNYLDWWADTGPEGSQDFDVYLRTAVSVDPKGWAQFDHVKMPDYRWGIFLNIPGDPDRRIHFGDHKGEKAWHEYFGRDGRDEGEALLERRAGDDDNPRILSAFNEKTPDWLSLFMFTYFTDRDGKFQLCALAESGFDPLARTTKFMLTEEAHHMFVGETGVSRVVQRTCQVMNELKTDDPEKLRAAGVIDLETVQRYINFHYSVTIDLFGAEESSNAATFYSSGLKGRFGEGKRDDDHVLKDGTYKVLHLVNGALREVEVPMLNALNEVLRDDYITDSQGGISRWNKVIAKAGIAFRLQLPHKAFHRRIGSLAGVKASPEGRVSRDEEWHARVGEWLPTDEDRGFVASLMGRVVEPGKFANWIAPPVIGVNRQPVNFEYVRLG
ncbi:Benzoyl-CoA oxygenase component B [Geodia barretti]|uniref:Benzoyl-CoA oxygenase component B n=1 Tax=Geodia barretti TaxID=519541 RepID=A0AA35X690_GEOBA|nr:Benzoyl-CoA oxygenase component B [Geodia barretti]